MTLDADRLPLQTGATYLRNIALVGCVLLAVWMVLPGPRRASPYYSPEETTRALMAVYWVYFLPITAFILRAWFGKSRASDCIFGPGDLRIEGGRYDRFQIAWNLVSSVASELDSQGRLMLDLGEGNRVPIGMASDGDERRSLETIAALMQERITKRSPSLPEVHTHQMVTCSRCGAPAELEDADAVACIRCGQSIPLAADLRSRIQAAIALPAARAQTSRLIEKLLDQPRAKVVNFLTTVLALVVVAWLPLPTIYRRWDLVCGTVAIALVLGLITNLFIADRRAVRALSLSFAARRPRSPKEAPGCRWCGAPLAKTSDRVLVSCIYCEADNVLGVDLGADLARTATSQKSLEETLGDRIRARNRARALAVVGILLLGGLGYVLRGA